jgi:hypothetical protein
LTREKVQAAKEKGVRALYSFTENDTVAKVIFTDTG